MFVSILPASFCETMIKGFVKFIVALLLIVHGIAANTQSRYRFFTLGMEQGLTSDFTWSICQDRYNYMWIGTSNGLNRYDGHNIKQYFHSDPDSSSIPGNSIYWIHKDHDGDIWFSLGGNGVAVYNYAKDRFDKFPPFDSIKQKNKYGAPLWRMGSDLQNRIYFACGGACFRYNKETRKMEDLTPLFHGAIADYGVAMFIPQGKELLWILTDNGLFRYDLIQNNINKIPFDVDKMGFGNEAMHDGEFINDHEMLISVVKTGFVLFNTTTGTFRMPPAPFDPTLTKKYSETGGVLRDSKGRIWLANSRFGLLEYFPASNTTYSLKNERTYPYPFPEQEGGGMHVYEDNTGNIWYGNSRKGVIWFNPARDFVQVYQRDFSSEHSLPDDAVTYFLSLAKNKILVGTQSGIAEFDVSTNQFKTFPVAQNANDKFPDRFVRSMVRFGDSVFISTSNGLSLYHIATGNFSRFINEIKSASIMPSGQWMIHKAGPGKILIEGNHLVEFDVNQKKYIYPSGTGGIADLSNINASYFDESTNTFWLEAGIAKLYAYDLTTKSVTEHHYTVDTSVKMIDAIRTDAQHKLWLATTNGLFYYDPLNKKGKKIDLATSTAGVYNIAIQDEDWIWLSTSKEIIKYNRINGNAVLLPINDIIPNSVIMKRAFMLDNEKRLWVGTNKGFCKIDINRFAGGMIAKEPQLVRFAVFDKALLFEKPFSELSQIDLNYTENFFSFQLSAFNFQPGNPVAYSYRLDDFDKEWQLPQNNSGSYTNVPPGTYRLHLRSSNGAGGWVEKRNPVIIHIKPPFWQATWFIVLMILVALFMLIFIYRLIKKRRTKAQVESTIDYFANSSFSENTVTEVCNHIARNCISQMKLKTCIVYLFDQEKNALAQMAAYGLTNSKEHTVISPVNIEPGYGIVNTLVKGAKPLLIRDSPDAPGDGTRHISQLSVPIIHEGKTIGVILSEHSNRNFFTKQHVKALSTIAAISANKIAETKAEETTRETEIKLLEIQKLLAESQLMALRAQMNPHFVFNCLNSIQEFILTENLEQASLYLNQFSKLFRSVLNNSGKVMITLAEEIDVLEMYLSLEYMRFEKSFNYKIETDDELEKDDILIPSMLLQPYVENALWHGLMHKQGDRFLDICFKQINEDRFQCIVEDNGIGRKKALELKEEQGTSKRHVSKGMSISKDRIELLQKQGHHAALEIIDKYNANNEATGTRVVIELSTYLNA